MVVRLSALRTGRLYSQVIFRWADPKATVRSVGFYVNKKNPLTPVGIEQETFRFVAQHLRHCAVPLPSIYIYISIYTTNKEQFYITYLQRIRNYSSKPLKLVYACIFLKQSHFVITLYAFNTRILMYSLGKGLQFSKGTCPMGWQNAGSFYIISKTCNEM